MRFTTGLGLLMGITLGMFLTDASSKSRIAKEVGERVTSVSVQKCAKDGNLTLTRKD